MCLPRLIFRFRVNSRPHTGFAKNYHSVSDLGRFAPNVARSVPEKLTCVAKHMILNKSMLLHCVFGLFLLRASKVMASRERKRPEFGQSTPVADAPGSPF